MRPLSVAITPGQSVPGSNGNKGVLRIPQSPSLTGTSPPDCLVSYPGHSLWWWWGLTPLQRSSRCILQPQPTRQEKREEENTPALTILSMHQYDRKTTKFSWILTFKRDHVISFKRPDPVIVYKKKREPAE